jgi:hypothetical protein
MRIALNQCYAALPATIRVYLHARQAIEPQAPYPKPLSGSPYLFLKEWGLRWFSASSRGPPFKRKYRLRLFAFDDDIAGNPVINTLTS